MNLAMSSGCFSSDVGCVVIFVSFTFLVPFTCAQWGSLKFASVLFGLTDLGLTNSVCK